MSNVNAESKPSYYELSENELEKATGGGISELVVTKRMDKPSTKLLSDAVAGQLAN